MAEEDEPTGNTDAGTESGTTGYAPAEFERSTQRPDAGHQSGGFDAIMDIPVEISVEIGRTRMPISELIRLTPGSVVELERLAGEPLDVLANGRLVGRGEVVVMNDRYGMRLTEVVGSGSEDNS